MKRVELGISASVFLAISVGRLDLNKNMETLIKGIKLIDNEKVQLIVCGDGEKLQALIKQVQENNLGKRIQFLGSRTDMKDLYESSDCFALASYREGLSRSIMEAMACGLPCVVSKIRGNIDLIKNGVEGYLCDPKKPEDFAKAIGMLFENPGETKEMSANCINKAKKYDIYGIQGKLMDIYRNEMAFK